MSKTKKPHEERKVRIKLLFDELLKKCHAHPDKTKYTRKKKHKGGS